MKLIKTTLVGVGQIFLQDNGWSGLLIIIGMFFSHWTLGVTCFLGSLIGTLTAKAIKCKESDIDFGLYGFNGSLSFMCIMFTFALDDNFVKWNWHSPLLWFLGIAASIISTLIMHVFVKKGKVAFTFPFVLTCWIMAVGFSKLGVFGLVQTTPALPDHTSTLEAIRTPFFGWAEVNFGASWITGVFIFFAMAVSSPAVAMWGTAASAVGALVAYHIFGIDVNVLSNGIFSFSPILVACAFVTFSGPEQKRSDFLYVIFGVFLSVLIHQLFSTVINISPYTFDFIAASWIMLAVKKAVDKKQINSEKIIRALNP